MESLIDEFGYNTSAQTGDLLSGGERRTEIARCLATDPNLSCLTNRLPVSTLCRWRYTTNCSAIKKTKT
jgi:ABC-type lipopolysaccharide export system ATPase subunit